MNKKLIVLAILISILIFLTGYWWWQSDVKHNGRLFNDRNKLCQQIAVDYLRNIRNDPSFDDEKWNLAIDIETEIYNLCQLNLTKEDIINYTPSALEKYAVDIAKELEECLPKSDMASKERCDQLLETITSFQDCVDAGFIVLESYPEKCATPDGRTFINSIDEPKQ